MGKFIGNIDEEEIKKKVYRRFKNNISANFEIIYQLIYGVLDRMKEEESDLSDVVWEEIDTQLIYIDDEWEVAKIYCPSPRSCVWQEVLKTLFEDVKTISEEIIYEASHLSEDCGAGYAKNLRAFR